MIIKNIEGNLSFFKDNKKINYADGVKWLRREKLKLNTTQFGDLIGVTSRAVEDWEQGRREPNKYALLLIQKLIE